MVRDKRKSRPYIEPLLPSEVYPKKQKTDTPPPLPPAPVPSVAAPPPPPPMRSYTPPPLKDPRLKLSTPVTPAVTPPDEGGKTFL